MLNVRSLEPASIRQNVRRFVIIMLQKIIKILETKLNQGISFSCDIRVVERYLKIALDLIKGRKKNGLK